MTSGEPARRQARLEEPFVLTAMISLLAGTLWMWLRHSLFLEFFYSAELLALTHLITLGFVTSLMMGVLLRLAPMSLNVAARSGRWATAQFVVFFIGTSGMIFHFWIGEWSGLAWATVMVLAAAVMQLYNFWGLWAGVRAGDWSARYVAASLVYLVGAAALGVLLGFNKSLDKPSSLFIAPFTSNLFAHIHLAAVGWVTGMIFGFELKLLPTTRGSRRFAAFRFWLLHIGIVGLVVCWLVELSGKAVFGGLILAAVLWQAWGPTSAFVRGRAREWEVLPLLLLAATATTGFALACGIPPVGDPSRIRWQFAYAYAGLLGWIVLTITTVAFKLFPIWVWQERFQAELGRRPVPGMKDLYSHRLKTTSHVLVAFGVVSTVVGIVTASEWVLRISLGVVFAGILCFAINFVMMARWALLDLEYRGKASPSSPRQA